MLVMLFLGNSVVTVLKEKSESRNMPKTALSGPSDEILGKKWAANLAKKIVQKAIVKAHYFCILKSTRQLLLVLFSDMQNLGISAILNIMQGNLRHFTAVTLNVEPSLDHLR
ncbi:hypothetical protein T03_5648 [Trichinella britovi]|uniref:Uncharacterized protein n=1 Tax=Trichinella britovi TaxID=45882 RepID=A0A0V1C966_TRIBR|nr:hypothetical protein T03_5648 [Trichinella britovi]